MDERLHCRILVDESIAETTSGDDAEYHRKRFEYVVDPCTSPASSAN